MLDKVYQESQRIMYIGDKENSNADSTLVSTKRSLIFNELNNRPRLQRATLQNRCKNIIRPATKDAPRISKGYVSQGPPRSTRPVLHKTPRTTLRG